MARTKAISLIQNGETKVELAELSGLVIQNIQKDTLASGLKSQSYTGNPASGSVEYRRFKNSVSQDYGTARAAGKGTALAVPPTTVNLNTHKEIVEEAAKFAQQSGQALSRIQDVVTQTSENVGAIATAAQEQSATAAEMMESVETINTCSASTASIMAEATDTVASVGKLANELDAVIESMQANR